MLAYRKQRILEKFAEVVQGLKPDTQATKAAQSRRGMRYTPDPAPSVFKDTTGYLRKASPAINLHLALQRAKARAAKLPGGKPTAGKPTAGKPTAGLVTAARTSNARTARGAGAGTTTKQRAIF